MTTDTIIVALSGVGFGILLGGLGAWLITRSKLASAEKSASDKALTLERVEAELKAEREGSERFRSYVDHRRDEEEGLINKLTQSLDSRELKLREEQTDLERRAKELAKLEESIQVRLQEVAALSPEEAQSRIVAQVETAAQEEAARMVESTLARAQNEAHKRAKHVLVGVMQRSAVEYVTEATSAVVELPSEDMKGRIIGREGRNIRSFELVTGVDLVVDETPEAVVISSFDPIRREVARLTLMNMMLDGRIHPGRIEELHEKAQQEVHRMVVEAGERAATRAGITDLKPAVIEALGRLRFRTSFAQNVLDHSVEVASLASNIAAELSLNVAAANRAGLLHDIGKGLGAEYEGPHALTGMEFLRLHGEKDRILNAVGAHHFDIQPESPEAQLVIIADTLSAARPGARRENLDNYIKRLAALEAIANSFEGVEKSFAVQAGREIRLIVTPDKVDDLGARKIAREVAKRIEADTEHRGSVKVTVIRESRFSETAKETRIPT